MDEADTLNRIENKARKGKATDRELRILAKGYTAFGCIIPKDVMKIFKQRGFC